METKTHLQNIRSLDHDLVVMNHKDKQVIKARVAVGELLDFFLHIQQVESQKPAQTQLASNVKTPLLTVDAERPCQN